MAASEDEEELSRSDALPNGQRIDRARRQFDEDVRNQSEWLRVTLASICDAVITTDAEGRVTFMNGVAESLTGWTQAEALGLPLPDVFHIINENSRHSVENPAVRALREGAVVGLANHTILVMKDGTEHPIDDSAAPIRDPQGNVAGCVLIFRDITDRWRAEKTTRFLAEASAALAELTDYESTLQRIAGLAVPFFADWCAVDMLEADGSVRRLAVTHVDPAKVAYAHELHRRYPPRPAEERGAMNVLRTGKSEWAAEIPQALIEETLDEEQQRILRELGLKSYILTPLRSRTRTLGLLTFVTAESGRAYNATDLTAAEDLANRAAIAIENASLLTALKESDRRKDEFLAMLAHELRNPLAPIQNAVQVMRREEMSPSQLQWATEVIDRQVHQMARLVDDLLDVSRITRGKIEIRKEPVELATVLNMAIEANRPIIEQWGHDLTVSIPAEPIVLDADPARLGQVLLNLLNNAAKYMEPNGSIWVTAEQQRDHVLIRVKDTGIGIPADMLPRVFEMFTQVDRSLERAEGGLGIGLPLVQRLVAMHGGVVEARSDGPGMGSEFIVRLPLAGEVKDTGPQGAAGGETFVAPATCRILVVDDNRDAAESLGMLLRMLGNEVHTAHDGLEAVGAAAAFQPDVVLLDIGLPKLNGYDAARRIRELAGGPEMVLIALTGWGQEEDRRRSTDAGFDHHMTKPIEFAALQALLAERNPDRARRRRTGRAG